MTLLAVSGIVRRSDLILNCLVRFPIDSTCVRTQLSDPRPPEDEHTFATVQSHAALNTHTIRPEVSSCDEYTTRSDEVSSLLIRGQIPSTGPRVTSESRGVCPGILLR